MVLCREDPWYSGIFKVKTALHKNQFLANSFFYLLLAHSATHYNWENSAMTTVTIYFMPEYQYLHFKARDMDILDFHFQTL